MASYSALFIPNRHYFNFTCKSVFTHGMARYAISVDGVFMVSSKYFWRFVLQKIFINCTQPFSLALDDITVPYSFLLRIELVPSSFKFSCVACVSCHAIRCPLSEFLAFNISEEPPAGSLIYTDSDFGVLLKLTTSSCTPSFFQRSMTPYFLLSPSVGNGLDFTSRASFLLQ